MSISRGAHRRLRQTGRLKTLAAVLVVLVLLPALIYSTYQWSALSTQETLVQEIYRQQLDVVLFSINQYAWDVVAGWFGELRRMLANGPSPSAEQPLLELIRSSQSIRAVFETDTSGSHISFFFSPTLDAPPAELAQALKQARAVVQRLASRARSGYQAVESFRLEASSPTIALIAQGTNRGGSSRVLGLLVAVDSIVAFVLAPKLTESAGEEFLFAVTQGNSKRLVYATAETDPAQLKQSRALWILPEYSLWVRLRTGTIEDVARQRFNESLVLVLALDLILLAGVYLVFRLARREVELAQLKSDFIASISHELRTPLSLIRMSAETLLLGRAPSPERTGEHHQIIVRETDRLTRLVNNVLLYSRLDARTKKLELAQADLNDIVRTALDDYGPEFARRGFTVEQHYARTPLPTMLNGEAVTEALLNLLDNAMKFSTERRTLRVRTGADGGEVYAEVEDSGIGIPPELHTKIFERFYRVTPSASNQKRGSGLGLTLVKQIMDVHDGRVDLQSEPGKGSTFRLVFPLFTPPATDL